MTRGVKIWPLTLGLSAFLFCVSATTLAWADFDSALAAYRAGNLSSAERQFESLAADGDGRAAAYLSQIRQARSSSSENGVFDWSFSFGGSGTQKSTSPAPRSSATAPSRPASGSRPANAKSTFSEAIQLPLTVGLWVLENAAAAFQNDGLRRDLRGLRNHGNSFVLSLLALVLWAFVFRAALGILRFIRNTTIIRREDRRDHEVEI